MEERENDGTFTFRIEEDLVLDQLLSRCDIRISQGSHFRWIGNKKPRMLHLTYSEVSEILSFILFFNPIDIEETMNVWNSHANFAAEISSSIRLCCALGRDGFRPFSKIVALERMDGLIVALCALNESRDFLECACL